MKQQATRVWAVHLLMVVALVLGLQGPSCNAYEIMSDHEAAAVRAEQQCNNRLKCDVLQAPCSFSCYRFDEDDMYQGATCEQRQGFGGLDPQWWKCTSQTYTADDNCLNNTNCGCCIVKMWSNLEGSGTQQDPYRCSGESAWAGNRDYGVGYSVQAGLGEGCRWAHSPG